MNERLKHYAQTILVIFVLLATFWAWQWIDGEHASIPFVSPDRGEQITATSTVEFDLSGIEDKDTLEEKLQIVIEETKARQQKQEATQKLQQLEKKKTSLR
jgi:hypothetical protein